MNKSKKMSKYKKLIKLSKYKKIINLIKSKKLNKYKKVVIEKLVTINLNRDKRVVI